MFLRVTSWLCNEIRRFCRVVTVWSKLALRMLGWGSLLCPAQADPSLVLMKVETFEQVEA